VAHFYGTLKGSRGEASRLGHKKSGLEVRATSWEGAVAVSLWYDNARNVDMAEVRLQEHHGHGQSRLLYRGPVSGCCEGSAKA